MYFFTQNSLNRSQNEEKETWPLFGLFFTQNSLNRSQNEEKETWPLFGLSGSWALVLKYKR